MFRILRKLRKDKSGVSAIEFAMLFPIILALTFFILESSWYFTRVVLFDSSVQQLTKDIYINSVGTSGLTIADLEEQICENFPLSGADCEEKLVLELTEVAGLTSLPTDNAECITFNSSNQVVRPVVDFNVGIGSSTIFLRACYSTEFFFPGIGFALRVATTDDRHNIISSTAFVNEPS
ncbi:MAG: TadE/TadG family type IV pilus assembly protein [Hyphomicrobiales bacterium]